MVELGRRVLDPRAAGVLGAAGAAVFGLGAWEGWLLSAGPAGCEAARGFAMHYGLANLAPSLIWSTVPAELCVALMAQHTPALSIAPRADQLSPMLPLQRRCGCWPRPSRSAGAVSAGGQRPGWDGISRARETAA